MNKWLRAEEAEINAANAERNVEESRKKEERIKQLEESVLLNQRNVSRLIKRVVELEEMMTLVQEALSSQIEINKHHGDRLHALEEKERQRARDKHQIEPSLDEISEPVPYDPPKEGEYRR